MKDQIIVVIFCLNAIFVKKMQLTDLRVVFVAQDHIGLDAG